MTRHRARDRRRTEVEPDTVEVPVPGGALAVARWRGEGTACVFLHSGITDRRSWYDVVRGLDGAGDCIAYDRRGAGGSTAIGDAGSVDDLLAVLDHLQVAGAWLVASSAGGQVALEAAVLHPDRVLGLVLFAPAVSGAPEPAEVDDHTLALAEQLEQAGDDVEERVRLEAWLWLDGPKGPEGRVAGPARTLLLEMDRRIVELGRAESAGTTVTDLWDRLPTLELPITMVAGGLDVPFLVQQCAAAAERLPTAELVLLPDHAHLPYLEDPQACARLIDRHIGRRPGGTQG